MALLDAEIAAASELRARDSATLRTLRHADAEVTPRKPPTTTAPRQKSKRRVTRR
jgi:hypothetical protein